MRKSGFAFIGFASVPTGPLGWLKKIMAVSFLLSVMHVNRKYTVTQTKSSPHK